MPAHVLGRDELATARKRISHRHFSVRVAPDGGADGRGGHVVEDLSQNGTWLDGTRCQLGERNDNKAPTAAGRPHTALPPFAH